MVLEASGEEVGLQDFMIPSNDEGDEPMPVIVLSNRRPQSCDLCGKAAELRPYGPKGEWVCFKCGMKDEPAAKRAFSRRLERGDVRLGDKGAQSTS